MGSEGEAGQGGEVTKRVEQACRLLAVMRRALAPEVPQRPKPHWRPPSMQR